MGIFDSMDRKLIKNIDWSLIVLTFAVSTIGMLAIAAATNSFSNGISRNLKMQLLAFVIGIMVMIIVIATDYSNYLTWYKIIYVGSIVLLLSVFIIGKSVSGSTSWIEIGGLQFQPAEIAKIAIILALAKHLSEKKNDINTFADLIPGAIIVGIPLLLILKQPDFGTAMVIIFITFAMYFAAGISYKLLLKIIVPVVTILPPVLWFFVFGVYQKNRILVFLNPELDPRGDGYNVLQSIISIGSGQLSGYGIASPDTTEYVKFIPVKESDFIFSVVGRAFGFIGCAVIVLLFLTFLLRFIKAAKGAKDDFGMFVCIGVAAMFAIHILENIGMSIGIMPCTGIPLPFISYGGTALIINMVAVALVININMRRQLIRF